MFGLISRRGKNFSQRHRISCLPHRLTGKEGRLQITNPQERIQQYFSLRILK
jgi:hypothetical protein